MPPRTSSWTFFTVAVVVGAVLGGAPAVGQQKRAACEALGFGVIEDWKYYQELKDKLFDPIVESEVQNFVDCLRSLKLGIKGEIPPGFPQAMANCPELLEAEYYRAAGQKSAASAAWRRYEAYRSDKPNCVAQEGAVARGSNLVSVYQALKDEGIVRQASADLEMHVTWCRELKRLGLRASCEPTPEADELRTDLIRFQRELAEEWSRSGDPARAESVRRAKTPDEIVDALKRVHGNAREAWADKLGDANWVVHCNKSRRDEASSVPRDQRGAAPFDEYLNACASHEFLWTEESKWGGLFERLGALRNLANNAGQVKEKYEFLRRETATALGALIESLRLPCQQLQESGVGIRTEATSLKRFCESISEPAVAQRERLSLAELKGLQQSLGEIKTAQDWDQRVGNLKDTIVAQLAGVRGNCQAQTEDLNRVRNASENLVSSWSTRDRPGRIGLLQVALSAKDQCEYGVVVGYLEAVDALSQMRGAIQSNRELAVCPTTVRKESAVKGIADTRNKLAATQSNNQAALVEFRADVVTLSRCVSDALKRMERERADDQQAFRERAERYLAMLPNTSGQPVQTTSSRLRRVLESFTKAGTVTGRDDVVLTEGWKRSDAIAWSDALGDRMALVRGDADGHGTKLVRYCVAAHLLAVAVYLDKGERDEAAKLARNVGTECEGAGKEDAEVVKYFEDYTAWKLESALPRKGLPALGFDTNFEASFATAN